jgi:hypothetical protein
MEKYSSGSEHRQLPIKIGEKNVMNPIMIKKNLVLFAQMEHLNLFNGL